ncbi:MAG: hypothetical protein ABI024_03970, partial [Vicinamibacterales bacterium]
PCPDVVSMTNPVRRRLVGITGPKHAEREGLFLAADLAIRTRTVKCSTEMQGMLPAFMSPVRWMPDLVSYGQAGDVAFWDDATLTMGLSEPPVFGASNVLVLVRDDGTLTDPVEVLPGPTEWDVVLPAAPDFSLIVDSGTRERPKFLFGPTAAYAELVKIARIGDGGKGQGSDGVPGAQLFDIEAVIDDERVHAADNHLLPGPGEIQDPVNVAADMDEDGNTGVVIEAPGQAPVVNLEAEAFGARAGITDLAFAEGTYRLLSDGHAEQTNNSPAFGAETFSYPGKWMLYGTIEPAVAALYEVKFSLATGYDAFSPRVPTGDVLDTWLNLGTDRTLTLRIDLDLDDSTTWEAWTFIDVQIRKVGETALQDVGFVQISLTTRPADTSGIGGIPSYDPRSDGP